MNYKRITLFAGHYGSGKTNLAVNYALQAKKDGFDVSLADLDIVNPYFRAKDSKDLLKENGISLISSAYANTNVDVPALPPELYSIIDNKNSHYIIDVGGDDRGALALGRISSAINEENNYEMFLIINKYRPLTRTKNEVLEIKNEIETACNIKFTAIINNSNLGTETCAQDILNSLNYAQECSGVCLLPLKYTSVDKVLYNELKDKINNLMPIQIERKLFLE